MTRNDGEDLDPSERAEVEELLAVFETAPVNAPVWVRCMDCHCRRIQRYCQQTRGGAWVCVYCRITRREKEREYDYRAEAAQYGIT